jgi:hypothetical protein
MTNASPDGYDVAALVAERDALRAQLEAGTRGRHGRLRRTAAVVLVVVFGLSFLSSGVGIWLHRSTLNEDVWSDRVVPLGQDPQVQQALATWATGQLMATVDAEALFEEALPERGRILATPLSAAVEGFVGDRVDRFFASERFEELWARAAVRAHEGAVAVLRDERPNVVAGDDEVTIDLIPVLDAVLADILRDAPGLIGSDVELPEVSVEDLPDEVRARLALALGVELDEDFGTLTVYDGGKLSSAQEAVRFFDRFVLVTSLLTISSAVAAVWLSPRRRRTLLQLLGAAALVCIVVRRAGFTLQEDVVELVRVEGNRGAVSVVTAAFVDPLTSAAWTVLWILALVAIVVAVTGPYGWAVGLRRRLSQSTGWLVRAVGEGLPEGGRGSWVGLHVDALRAAGYALGAAILWFADLTWWTLVLVAVGVAAWQVVLHRIAGPSRDGTGEVTGPVGT